MGPIAKPHIAELYLMLEALDGERPGSFLDGVLGHQDFVDTLHRGQSLGNIVGSLREVFQGVNDAVEHYHIINEEGAGE